MQRTGRFILAALILPYIQACTPASFYEEDFAGKGEISLYVKGMLQLEYSPETHQFGFNPAGNEIRVSDDNMADYFILTFDEMPSEEGQTVTASIEYTTSDDIRSKDGIEFRVTKTDLAEGKIWLWNAGGKIGAVIPVPERLE